MIELFSSVVDQSRLGRIRLVTIDNLAFRVHYRLTFAILLACTVLVCSRQYVGEHIQCVADGIPEHVVNTYCFFTTTYTLPGVNNSIHPGVGPAQRHSNPPVHHAYYQWVPFVLFGQAMLFYVPHLVWKSYEAGTIGLLVDGLQRLYLRAGSEREVTAGAQNIPSEATKQAKVRVVLNHLDAVTALRTNRVWAAHLIGCEILNVLNVVFQLVFMDKFLAGQFYTYGLRVFDGKDGSLSQVFPKMTKCDFHKYGPSGDIQTHDALCVMALNVINDKIYAMLWFWFIVVLLPVSVAALLWRVVQLVLHSFEFFNKLLLREACPGVKLDPSDLVTIGRNTSYPDWLFMYYLSCNMDGFVFRDLVHSFAVGLRKVHGSRDVEEDVPMPRNETSSV